MKAILSRLRSYLFVATLLPCHLVTLSCFVIVASSVFVATSLQATAKTEDEQALRDAGLTNSGPALLAFFHARARTEIDREPLQQLLVQCVKGSPEERERATAELLGLGPLALPGLRREANDVDHPELAARALKFLPWLEGPASNRLLIAAAQALARHKTDGAAEALLAYLPLAEDGEVIRAVHAALAAVAAPHGKPDPALLRGLSDRIGVRRAAAAIALSQALPPEQVPDVRKLLSDPAPLVRLRAALALAEAHDAEAIPVLIDLLGVLPASERQPIEDYLIKLAGEWAPAAQFASEDKIGRRIRRDVWAAWWRNTDSESLLAALREHTLTSEDRVKIAALLERVGSDDFNEREKAAKELFSLGRICIPQLREVAKSKDTESAHRANRLIERIERDPIHHLPAAAVRLLALRKPPRSVETLLAYLPFAEDEAIAGDTKNALAALALRDGKPHPALMQALKAVNPEVRATVAECLLEGGGPEGRAAARALLTDDSAEVRLRVALAVARSKDREGVPVLIELLTVLPPDRVAQVEASLYQLAGDTAPDVSAGSEKAERKKCRDSWMAWWKVNSGRVDLTRLTSQPWYGYTLICDIQGNRVYELDRQGKQRWLINNAGGPTDARILPGNRVLIAEYGADRVSERDFNGKILWEKHIANPVNVQRLPNGNTFVATVNGPMFELDRAGNEVSRINSPGGANIMAAVRTRRGTIVALTQTGQCITLDTAGRELKSFTVGRFGNGLGGIDVTHNGRVIVAQQNRNKVVEYDADGKSIVEVDAPNAVSATGLPNGHFLVSSQNAQRVFEVDRSGKIIWEHTNAGQTIRARRR
jgi:HEAT repeat protein